MAPSADGQLLPAPDASRASVPGCALIVTDASGANLPGCAHGSIDACVDAITHIGTLQRT
jgi:hypothetical protein